MSRSARPVRTSWSIAYNAFPGSTAVGGSPHAPLSCSFDRHPWHTISRAGEDVVLCGDVHISRPWTAGLLQAKVELATVDAAAANSSYKRLGRHFSYERRARKLLVVAEIADGNRHALTMKQFGRPPRSRPRNIPQSWTASPSAGSAEIMTVQSHGRWQVGAVRSAALTAHVRRTSTPNWAMIRADHLPQTPPILLFFDQNACTASLIRLTIKHIL